MKKIVIFTLAAFTLAACDSPDPIADMVTNQVTQQAVDPLLQNETGANGVSQNDIPNTQQSDGINMKDAAIGAAVGAAVVGGAAYIAKKRRERQYYNDYDNGPYYNPGPARRETHIIHHYVKPKPKRRWFGSNRNRSSRGRYR